MSKDESLDDTLPLVSQWATRLGFGHYSGVVELMPKKQRKECYARCFFDHEEEWYGIEIVPDGTIPKEQLEGVIVHEFTHGLISYAALGKHEEERVCNRISRLAIPGNFLVNQHASLSEAFDTKQVGPEWVKLVVESLPEKEQEAITRLYYEGDTYAAVARDLGFQSVRSFKRWRDKVLADMKGVLDGLPIDGEDGTTD